MQRHRGRAFRFAFVFIQHNAADMGPQGEPRRHPFSMGGICLTY